MTIENNEASANIGDPVATVSRRFSVAPMMDWAVLLKNQILTIS
ncbi:hypothetical protein [Pseudomonas syringae]|nr:hypothetical protein [Pseudomonas syringae]